MAGTGILGVWEGSGLLAEVEIVTHTTVVRAKLVYGIGIVVLTQGRG